jgi:hypothetical protein
VQAEEGESDDPLVDEDRVPLAARDELREGEGDRRRADRSFPCLSLLAVRGVLVPERSDHVHEHARALALHRRRVGTLDECEDLVQSRRLGAFAARWQGQIIAILG